MDVSQKTANFCRKETLRNWIGVLNIHAQRERTGHLSLRFFPGLRRPSESVRWCPVFLWQTILYKSFESTKEESAVTIMCAESYEEKILKIFTDFY